jgi:glycosyltransferase involved in cell wall biosynthesis
VKIVHVSPSFARREGGPSEVLRGLMPALEARGVDWQVVTTDKGLTHSDEEFARNGRVHVAKSRYLKSWTFSLGILPLLIRSIKGCDAVHIHSIHTFPSSAAMMIARFFRKPFVLEPHGSLDSYHLRQGNAKKLLYSSLVDGRSLRQVSGLIYSSKMELEEGRAFLPNAPSFLMTLGVSRDLLDIPDNPSRSKSTILFLGRVTDKKRLDLLIEALATGPLKNTSSRLIVAGPIDPRLSYSPASLAVELGVADRIDFLGQVDSDERRKLLFESTVFALPSEDESFGIAVAEALAAGCPVVCSNRVGIAPEAAASGALVLSTLSASDLADHLSKVLISTPDQLKLSSRGRGFAADTFTWDRSAEQAIEIYSTVTDL